MAMKCPECGIKGTNVLSTRERKKSGAQHRRYEYNNLHRFSTLEQIVPQKIVNMKVEQKK